MKTKILTCICLTFAVIITISGIVMLSFESDKSKLSDEEINKLEREQSAYSARHMFTGGDVMFLKKWCTDNKGFWRDMGLDRGECMFETKTQYHLASMLLDELQKPTVTGKPAQEICRFLALECPQRAAFDGHYQIETDRTFVNYNYKNTMYRFDVSDEDQITFTAGDSQEQFSISESTTLEDKFSIRVKTGYDYYTLGERIGINGRVSDNHQILSQTDFQHPVILQIITEESLVEVAQLEVLRDGQFKYIINTGGHAWKPGEYEIRTTYDTYTATATFDMDKETR